MAGFGGGNVWRVSADERASHDAQFFALKPVNGFISGDQARGLLMKSGLPSNVLAQIWNLADLNKDGRMDKKEFSIAMHLIQKKLQGFTIPATLPPSMMSDPQPSIGTFGPGMAPRGPMGPMPHGGMMQPSMPGMGMMPQQGAGMNPNMGAWPAAGMPPAQNVGFTAGPVAGGLGSSAASPIPGGASPRSGSTTLDWSMPHNSKLKYSQMFNNLDKSRIGKITGVYARNILCQSGLPNPVLAQIWGLSDLDKDGQLSVDEFCLAMHLVDVVKATGATLPATVPPILMPLTARARTTSVTSTGSGGASVAAAAAEAEEELKKASIFHSFEDRRKDNFDRGQAELEKRRAALQEMERKDREERERKERAEFERKERERQEQERRRQLEMEKHMARQREVEMQRQEEQRKIMEQREAARREMERQRTMEQEKQRAHELTLERQREQELVCHSKQKQKNLTFQLQALGEKSTEMNSQITDMRDKIVTITGTIDTMKRSRDTKMSDIEQINRQINEARNRMQAIGQAKFELQSRKKTEMGAMGGGMGSSALDTVKQVDHSMAQKQMSMQKLQESLAEIESETKQKRSVTEERKAYLASLQSQLSELKKENREEYDKLIAKQKEAKVGLDEYRRANPAAGQNNASAFPDQTSFGFGASAGDGFANDWPGTDSVSAGADPWPASGNETSAFGASANNADGSQPTTSRYRAIYEFVARSDDELSFQPGDVILVFKDHGSLEPGWLAGQIKEKVGWFPESFAECIEDGEVSSGGGAVPGGGDYPAMSEHPTAPQKLPSIDEKEEEGKTGAVKPSPSQPSIHSQQSQGAGAGEEGKALTATALYPWKAKKEAHLSFQKGDQIKIVEQQEMWWLGELNGAEGWFPKSYVRLTDGPRRSQAGSRSQTPGSEIGEKPPTPLEGPTLSMGESGNGEWVVSLYAFAGPEAGDLQFDSNERILVTKKEEDWWTGVIGDRTGIFPSSYVQPEAAGDSQPFQTSFEPAATQPTPAVSVAPAPPPAPLEVGKVIAPFTGTAANQLTLQAGDMISIRTKSPTGWWEGELSRKGAEKRSGWFPGNYVKIMSDHTQVAASQSLGGGSIGSGTSNGATGEANIGDTVEAQYDYVAQQDDELSFTRGDKITLTEKIDAEWWKGKGSGGSEGLFPANYVKVIG